ncbi:MAG: hypothetical protein LBO68_03945 [Synergistaceae bacterium]|nr:hypothetical protein [Synergistaceae bacterium]
MSSLDAINTMLHDMPEMRHIGRDDSSARDIEKKLAAWDRVVEAVHAAHDEDIFEFERVRFDRETA